MQHQPLTLPDPRLVANRAPSRPYMLTDEGFRQYPPFSVNGFRVLLDRQRRPYAERDGEKITGETLEDVVSAAQEAPYADEAPTMHLGEPCYCVRPKANTWARMKAGGVAYGVGQEDRADPECEICNGEGWI